MKYLLILLGTIFMLKLSAQTTVNASIAHSTGTRTYQLYIPASYDGSTAVPLVFNLHGYGSNNTQQMAYGNFKPIADTANFIIAAPQGLLDNTNTAHWNAEWGTGVDDVSFISDLIDTISNDYNINPNRIYSTGMSNGGFMSFTLAGELSDKIAAIASVTGTMSVIQVPANTVSRPMPVMQIHGTADATVNYNGDQYFLSVDSVLNYWVDHNNCNPTPIITSVTNTSTSDGCTAEKYEYLNGDNGSEVVHYKVTNGAHTWPGSAFTIGVTNQDFDASSEIWRFFLKYEIPTLTNIKEFNQRNWISISSQNPTNEFVSFHLNEVSGPIKLSIFNLEGKVIDELFYTSDENVSLLNMNSGVYLFKFSSEKMGDGIFKVIKE